MKKLLASIFLALMCFMPSFASAAECTLYEQSHPKFLLDGSHLSSGKCQTCASCHKSGVFVGTPTSCATCHSGDPTRATVGRSTAHIPTQMIECSGCHKTLSFTINANMDHTLVTAQRCDTCHNGNFLAYNAMKKPKEHIPTIADCVSCHNTKNWDVNHQQLHAGITTGCVACHDGKYAPGKSSYTAGHPITSDACETCHSINNQFKCASALDKLINFAQLQYNRFFA